MVSSFPYSGPLPAFAATSGPRNAKIALVAEAWGQQEELTKQPLIGTTGQELNRMLEECGLHRRECFATNVFALRPTANNIELLCDGKKVVSDLYKTTPSGKLGLWGIDAEKYDFPGIKQGKYIEPRFFPEILRLREELEQVQPNLIIALGAIASWALLSNPKIGSIRGAIAESTLLPSKKVLPTFHPSAVYRNWSLRTIVLADLLKAKRECEYPEIQRPQRFVLVRPSIAEMWGWWRMHGQAAPMLSIDIETTKGQIKNIGFSSARNQAINVPIIFRERSYWQEWEEFLVWQFIKYVCESPAPKLFQNGLYDLQYIWRMGIRVVNVREDTMLLHHSLYPEMQKSLGFMGSIYSNEPAWKLLRKQSAEEALKRDD